jgi:NADH-quinone oxidoreductase subunit C
MLKDQLQAHFGEILEQLFIPDDIITIECSANHLLDVTYALRDADVFRFEIMLDLCGVDYLHYGQDSWRTTETTNTGFSRGVIPAAHPETVEIWAKPRYAVVYHLLSVTHNHRLRLRVFLEPEPEIDSVIDVWPAANWYEREAFDLYGIVFKGHPDLRRLLTDYGFKGHPFRKDFPLIGEVELRYDAQHERCVYEPVSINPRVLVPKVIRHDNRYAIKEEDNHGGNS